MKGSSLLKVLLAFIVGVLVGYYVCYYRGNRFWVVHTTKNFAYKLDRHTGQIWLLYGTQEVPVIKKQRLRLDLWHENPKDR